MKFAIRALRPDDETAFAALVAARPGHTPETAAERARLVQHLAFRNPSTDGEPHYFVLESGDRLMGHMGRMPTWFWIEGRRHLATFAHDLFVHPELQASGQGFFATMRLYKSVEQASKSFVAMCWTNDINIRLQQTRKYDQLWVDRLVRPMRVDGKLGVLRRVRPALERAATAAGNALLRAADTALRASASERPTLEVRIVDGRFDDLTERIGPAMGIAPVKDAAYLRYKYVGRPALSTRIFAAESAPDRLVGFIVLRETSGPTRTGTILDLAAHPDDAQTIDSLLGRALAFYAERAVGSIEAVATDPRIARHLARLGFVRRGDKLPLFYANGALYPRPRVLADTAHWHHMYGDSEGPY
jgi:hypothetical protein